MNKINIGNLKSIEALYKDSFITVPKATIARMGSTCTVGPKQCSAIRLFGKDISLPRMSSDQDTETIHANFWGPMERNEFFAIDPKYRVTALLKEDYILKDSFNNGDRGGHDKAAEFQNEADIMGNPTYRTLAYILAPIIQLLDPEAAGSPALTMKGHTAIANVSPFPGLAMNGTKSNDKKLEQWAPLVRDILQEQVNLYAPRLVYSGHVLYNFLSNKELYSSLVRGEAADYGYVFDRRIVKAAVVSCPLSNPIGIYTDEQGAIWLDENHPQNYTYYSDESIQRHIDSLLKGIRAVL